MSGHTARTVKHAITPTKLKELCLLPERPSTAGEKRELCRECGRYSKCDERRGSTPFLFEKVQEWNRNILVLFGQRPSEESLDFLVTLFRECGVDPRDYTDFDAVHCETSKSPTSYEIRACRPFLVGFIQYFRPRVVLAIGSVALRSATDDGKLKTITGIRGIPYAVKGCEDLQTTVYGTYDPQGIIDGAYFNRPRLKEDVLRCKVGGLPRLSVPHSSLSRSTTLGVDSEFCTDGLVVTLSAASAMEGTSADSSNTTKSDALLRRIGQGRVLQGHSTSVDVDSVLRLARERNVPLKSIEAWVQGRQLQDSLLLSRMTDETRGKGGYKLENLLRSSFHTPLWKDTDEDLDLSDPTTWPTDYRLERCRMDAWASSVLCETYSKTAHGPIELTHRIAQTLRRIWHTGARVDYQYFQKIKGEFLREASKYKNRLLSQASAVGMPTLEPTNDSQLRELLFTRLGLTPTDRTKTTGLPSVNKTFLKNNAQNPTVKSLIEFNTNDKRYSTYGVGLETKFIRGPRGMDYFIRFRVNPLGAKTGRRSSDAPNAQNWPKDVRKIIISRFPGGVISDNDYSKLEVILLGWTAEEWKLVEFFQGENGYIQVGRELFGAEVKEGTPQYTATKSTVLGIQYGMGGKKLAAQLWGNVNVKLSADYEEHERLAQELRNTYLRKFPGIKRYMYLQKQRLLRDGAVTSLTGRVRHLPVPYGEDTPGFGRLLNQAINFPIQSLASDVTGSAMLDVEERLLDQYNLSYTDYHYRLMTGEYPVMPLLINEVHDDLVYDVPQKRRRDNLALISETMSELPTLRRMFPKFDVQLKVGQEAGERWSLKAA